MSHGDHPLQFNHRAQTRRDAATMSPPQLLPLALPLIVLLHSARPLLAFRTSLAVGAACRTNAREEGVCRPISGCPAAADSLQRSGEWPVTCGFQGREPIVCCAEDSAGHSLPGTAATSTTTTAPCTSGKSEEACQAYSNELPGGVRLNIIDGDLVLQGEMPHMAALGFASPRSSSVSWDCGGSLISDRYVLTAAHCFKRRDRRLAKVRLGGVDLTSLSEGAQEVVVENVILHPQYHSPYNDIALVRLARAVTFSETLFPACLYTRSQLSGDVLTVAGWGATDTLGDVKSDFLLKAVVQNMAAEKCGKMHRGNPMLRDGIADSMVCAHDPRGRTDTCSGDSGGPLQALTEDVSNVYSIVGVTSLGSTVCASSTPAIYTKVSTFVPWIESIVWP